MKKAEGVGVLEFFLVVQKHIGIFFLDLQKVFDLCNVVEPLVMCVLRLADVIDEVDKRRNLILGEFMVLDDNEDRRNKDGKDVLM